MRGVSSCTDSLRTMTFQQSFHWVTYHNHFSSSGLPAVKKISPKLCIRSNKRTKNLRTSLLSSKIIGLMVRHWHSLTWQLISKEHFMQPTNGSTISNTSVRSFAKSLSQYLRMMAIVSSLASSSRKYHTVDSCRRKSRYTTRSLT